VQHIGVTARESVRKQSKGAGIMMSVMNEIDALRTHLRQLNHAVATTTCRKTVHMLRQMLSETEAKLDEMNGRPRGLI
jgi:hypothetical protein